MNPYPLRVLIVASQDVLKLIRAHWENADQGEKIRLRAAGALGLAAFGLGSLFKLEHWPGAPVLLFMVPLFLFLIYFPMYITDKSIDPEKKHRY